MKISLLPAFIFCLGIIVSGSCFAEGTSDVCITAVPQSAALSTDGTIGLSFGSSVNEAGELAPYFQNFIEYPEDGVCFGDFAVKSLLSACEAFSAKHNASAISSPQESAPAAASCSAHSSRIAELEAQNNRLKRRIKRLRTLRD